MTPEQRQKIAQLYLEMHDPLLAYARSSLDNESLAEEAVQETFSIACTKPDDLLTCSKPKGWLVLTLKNTIRNMKRNIASANRLLIAYTALHGSDAAFSEDKLSLDLTYGNVSPSEDFKLLKEMAVEGKYHLEMAQARGISVDACKKRVERAKKKLRKKI